MSIDYLKMMEVWFNRSPRATAGQGPEEPEAVEQLSIQWEEDRLVEAVDG